MGAGRVREQVETISLAPAVAATREPRSLIPGIDTPAGLLGRRGAPRAGAAGEVRSLTAPSASVHDAPASGLEPTDPAVIGIAGVVAHQRGPDSGNARAWRTGCASQLWRYYPQFLAAIGDDIATPRGVGDRSRLEGLRLHRAGHPSQSGARGRRDRRCLLPLARVGDSGQAGAPPHRCPRRDERPGSPAEGERACPSACSSRSRPAPSAS